MLSKVGRKRAEEELEHLVKVDLPEAQERLGIAKEAGDLSENEPYNIALQDTNRIRLKISELQDLLSMETSGDVYSHVIGIGTFIDVTYILPDGEVAPYGLHIFDATGSSLLRSISPNSELGRKIQGTLGGEFEIKDPGGRTLKAVVKVLDEGKLEEYLDLVPSAKEGYAAVFNNVK